MLSVEILMNDLLYAVIVAYGTMEANLRDL